MLQTPKFSTPVVSLFKAKTTIGVFRLIILSLVVHMHFFVVPPTIIIPKQCVLIHGWLSPLAHWPTIFLALIYHIIVIVQALRLNYILGNNKLFSHSNFTVAMAYILFTGLIPAWCNITAGLLANILIIALIKLLCQLYTTQKPGNVLFNIGFLTGIGVLLYPPTYPLLLIMLLAIFILRPFKINQLFTYLIGVIIPVYFLASYLYLIDELSLIWTYIPELAWEIPVFEAGAIATLTGSLSIIAIAVFLGFLYMQGNLSKLLILARKCWIILCLELVLLIPIIFTLPDFDWSALILLMPAAAAIAGNLFYYNKQKIFLSVIFWLFIFSAWFYSFNGWQLLHK